MSKAAIYARVSSTGDRKDTARQVADLQKYAAAAGLEVVRYFEEKASGAKDDREVLAGCLDFLRSGGAGTLLLSELSRLGRNVRKILDVADDLTKAGVNIHILDLNIDTLLPDGTENPVAKMLLTVLGLGAEIERRNIVSRLNSGRKRAIENGVKMGRKEGSGLTDGEILAKYPKVVSKLRKGLSVRDAAAACGVSPATVQKVKRAAGKKPAKKQPVADDSAGKLSGLARYAWAWENGKSAAEMAEEIKDNKRN